MNENKFKKIAEGVESEWKMGGLSDGLYYDYALEVCKRYIKDRHPTSAMHSDGECRCDCLVQGFTAFHKPGCKYYE